MKYKITLLLLLAFAKSFSQFFNENFEDYTTLDEVKKEWSIDNTIKFDTENKTNHITSLGSFSLIQVDPQNRIGKIEIKTKTKGIGIWSISVYTNNTTSSKPESWKKINNLNIFHSENYSTTTIDINSIEKLFLKFVFELKGESSQLYINEISYNKISLEAEKNIDHLKRLEAEKIIRDKEITDLIKNNTYNSAKTLMGTYENDYKKRVTALAMLARKSVAIELVSGTASNLGSYNQLSNPLNYDQFKKLKKELFTKLEPIEQLYFNDEIANKTNSFFEKINDPLNFISSVGDIFTGGAVSKLVSGFKSLVTKGFSPERLLTKGFKKKKNKLEHDKGIELYKNANKFLEIIEQQNSEALFLNRKIFNSYVLAKGFNEKVYDLLKEYLAYENILLENKKLNELIKNEQESDLFPEISKAFKTNLGTSNNFNVNKITNQTKKIDIYFAEVDELIKDYEELTNSLVSFYSDFNTKLKEEPPYENINDVDEKYWKDNISSMKKNSLELQTKFTSNYLNIEFIKE